MRGTLLSGLAFCESDREPYVHWDYGGRVLTWSPREMIIIFDTRIKERVTRQLNGEFRTVSVVRPSNCCNECDKLPRWHTTFNRFTPLLLVSGLTSKDFDSPFFPKPLSNGRMVCIIGPIPLPPPYHSQGVRVLSNLDNLILRRPPASDNRQIH